jgi:uncharacterized Tic20 family protein
MAHPVLYTGRHGESSPYGKGECGMSTADEIGKLNELKQRGAIDEQEYQKAKESLLAKDQPAGTKFKQAVEGLTSDVNKWGMFIHLSQFCGYLVPLAGLIVPIVLWQIKKNDSAIIDQHGRVVVNWVITEFILAIIFALLCFVLVGIPLLIVLVIAGIVFTIVGALKANDGKVWPYPCSIKFFK